MICRTIEHDWSDLWEVGEEKDGRIRAMQKCTKCGNTQETWMRDREDLMDHNRVRKRLKEKGIL